MAKKKTSKKKATTNGKALSTQGALDSAVWSACDILRRSNVASAIQYVPELTWLLFLRILDDREEHEAAEAKAVGADFKPSLAEPYRWRDWAATDSPMRAKLFEAGSGEFFTFVNQKLLPYLHGLRDKPNATPRQKVISEIMSGVERVRVDTERNMLEVLDKVHQISDATVDDTHIFALSQVYEGLLLKLGEKSGDGGQFFTPREIIRAMVRTVAPDATKNETVYDPCCGTGGFLAQSYDFMREQLGPDATARHLEQLKQGTFFGREKENLIYPIALANLVLHGIDRPNLWHGNTLTGGESYGGLFTDAPPLFDVVLTNPPFGGKEGADAKTRFAYKTSATEVLFMQHVLDSMKPGGRCGIVLPEGVLFKTNEKAFVQTKRKLLDDCDLWCIVSLPGGVFTQAGAGVKTNLLFFTKGGPTKSVWYYDLSDVKVTKRKPFTRDLLDEFFKLLPKRADSERSWTVSREELEERGLDIKAVNPNAKVEQDTRTPAELIETIEAAGKEADEAIARLKELLQERQ